VSDPDRTADRPATFREVLASGEYRAVYGASVLSWFGDYLARAAVTAMVFRQTGSVTASAVTFAISYLPWLGIGPVLTALAERYPYRRVMIGCDLARMALMGLIAVPKVPVPAMMLLLFATALLNPPFDASRSALLPRILDGDRYVVGLALNSTSFQFAQIVGYLAGGTLGAINPRLAIALNAASFGLSAFLVGLGVHDRPPAVDRANGTHLLRETAAGFRVVFGNPVLRAIAISVFVTLPFVVVPEALAAAWAARLAHSDGDRGLIQGLIMMAYPTGFVIGGLVVSRLMAPSMRRRLIRPFAVLAPLALVPALADPPVWVIIAMCAVCGVATAGMLPAANGLFVQALPDGYRARAFGVMQTGIMLVQAIAVFVTGALADRFELPTVVGLSSLLGVTLVILVSLTWPATGTIVETLEAARAINSGSAGSAKAGPAKAGPAKAGPAPGGSAQDTPVQPAARLQSGPRHAAHPAAVAQSVDGSLQPARPPGAHRRAADGQAVDGRVVENRAVDNRPIEGRTAENRSGETNRPAETKARLAPLTGDHA
jgi:MFS family permease